MNESVMSGKDGKRSKGRRNLHSHSKNLSTNAVNLSAASDSTAPKSKPFQPFASGVTMNVSDVATEFGLTLKSTSDDAERITELMDAPVDLDIPAHAISRGPNPYLDKCMYCNTPRSASQDGDEGLELLDLQLDSNTVIGSFTDPQSFSSLKLEIWTCANCRKVAGNFQSFLEANFSQTSYDLPFLHDKTCVDPLSCAKCQEERYSANCVNDNHWKDTEELKACWVELRSFVTDLYSIDELVPSDEQADRVKYLVDRLCSQDPHQLFLRLESLIREIVMEIKANLLVKLKENGYDTPELALDFTSSLLSQYEKLTRKAHILAQYLGTFSEHLRRFKVTWELLNKHLFHSIAHNDPAISNSGPTILEQLRQGSVQYERSKDDPYCSVRKRLLKFQEEMSVVVVVWRDCQQLIESYCQQEVKNTQKQVSSKARSFISQQRQFLKEQLMKEPLMDEALSETMKNLMAGHKSATERVRCHRCKRERCTCDECTITHMITCGIINSDKGEIPPPPNSFNFALDHTRSVMDITPPSMSSTTSSSGSVSPINIDDKLTTFYDLKEDSREEFSDALLSCDTGEDEVSHISRNSTTDGNVGDDEDEDDDDLDDFTDNQDAGSDEPHALQIPICELKDADALWEAVQQHQQQQQLIQQQQQLFVSQHSCNHCHQAKQDQMCPFQPRIDPELSRQLDAELAKSGLLPGGVGDGGSDVEATSADSTNDTRGSGDNSSNSGLCATCQCHACLKQSGHMISTSLPLQMPVSPPPAELHLYPHIHGLPQQHQQRYMLDLPSLPVKLPVKLDFDDNTGIQDHISYAYSDWDNTMQPRPGSLAAQHHHQLHQRHSALASDPITSPLVTSASPFTFDLASHLATHTTHTSTTNTASAFKSVAGKHLASSIPPTFNGRASLNSEGSSVDPTKPLEFGSHAKITQSCMNAVTSVLSSSFSPLSFSCPSSTLSSANSLTGVPVTTVTSKSGGLCHGPPCSRPTPVGGNVTSSKWERNHPQHCRKFAAGSSHLNKQMAGSQGQHPQHNIGVLPFTGGMQGPPPLPPSPAALKNFFPKRPTHPCTHAANQLPRSVGIPLHPGPASTTSTTAPGVPTTGGSSIPLSCTNGLSTMVNNIGVGTSNSCPDQEYDAHIQEDNCDSVDDSCSEKSSSTSTSNQKEGKYCDCCYCEFFGHNNTQVAKTSTNYIEMKDRLRKKLKKRQSENKHKQGTPKNGLVQEGCKEDLDPLDKKGLEGLLSFINGTDEDNLGKTREKEQTAKAAKRARQKQKKLEEKARKESSSSPNNENRQLEPEKTLRQLLINQTLNLSHHPALGTRSNMAKPKAKKPQSFAGKKSSEEEERDAISSPSRQEISCSSSLIIESTRSTISLVPKDPEKYAASPKRLLTSKNKETSQHMLQFLNALQSLEQQQQQNKNKSANCTSVINSTSASSQAKSNGTVNLVSSAKSSSGDCKINGVTRPDHHSSQQKRQQQQQHPAQQPKQPQSAKSVNGKVSQPAGTSSHITANGKSSGVDKSGQSQHLHMNGGPPRGQTVPAVSSVQSTTISSATLVSSTQKKSVVDSPGAGSESSASQSPSCGSKSPADQGKASSKTKKNKKKNKNGDISGVDEIFMPKSEAELDGDVDDFERELEEFKRFCFEPAEPKERRKIAVNVNLKDIFKKKTGMA